MFKKFYKKTLQERLSVLEHSNRLHASDIHLLQQHQSLSLETADTIIENCIGLYGVPLGIAPNFIINGATFHAPLATEEPSVIAAASYGAQIIAKSGGFHVLRNDRYMIGQIALYDVPNFEESKCSLLENKELLLDIANKAYPSIVKRGGGARDIDIAIKQSHDLTQTFLILYLIVDTKEAMGANMLNTMLEALVPYVEKITKGTSLMAILSNYATQSLVSVTATIPSRYLVKASDSAINGEMVRDRIVLAYQLASADPYRATTHNKGVMNGISALVLSSGNDTRAIEAGAHAFASSSGSYQPLTKWEKTDLGDLKGTITLPLPIGFVGGSISVHPTAQLVHRLAGIQNAKELAALIASLGLAQNLSALRALVSEGIQQGHMALQLKSLALSVGASISEVPILIDKLKNHSVINQEKARHLLNDIRKQ